MQRRFHTLSGFVLAGGESRRMGQPKHQLVLGGETMVTRQMRLLRSVCRAVAVVGPPEMFSGIAAPVFPDELPSRGPLGGIYTGLLHTRWEYNLFLGCDLPFVEVRALEYLVRRAFETRADVTVPEARDSWLQPLCAVYRRRVLATVRASLAMNANKTSGYLRRVRCQVIPWREISRAGFRPTIFANMNTAADYEAAKRILNHEL